MTWNRLLPILIAVVSIASAATLDLASSNVTQTSVNLARSQRAHGFVIKTTSSGPVVRMADDSGPAPDEAASIGARLIPNPLAMATLLAQPNRAAVNVVAPFRVTVGTSAVNLTSSGNVNGGVCLKALVPGQTLYIGVSSAVTTLTGWPMSDNESLCLEVRNANVLWGIASAAAQSVAVLPFSRF